MIKSCYIHIPFCNKICSYCDFPKLLNLEKYRRNYLDALEKEIDSIYKGEVLDTIYIGGGTPSCLSLNELKRLFQIVKKFKVSNNLEYTIEGNFESTTVDKLKLYREFGINRLSFGLESINPDNLKLLERSINTKQVEEVLQVSRKLEFQNHNIDLMYALPKESLEVLKKDLEYVFSLNVEHISTYSLIIENHTKLKINQIQNIDSNLDAIMYEEIIKQMKEHGYQHYEISNFSKPGYESRHNTTYWNNEEYYGFGLGASSYIQNERIENTKSITKYLSHQYRNNIETISIKDKIEYEILLNLRKKEGISLLQFQKKYHKPLNHYYDYHYLVENGFLVETEKHLFIPEEKWYISNEIIVQMLEREKYE